MAAMMIPANAPGDRTAADSAEPGDVVLHTPVSNVYNTTIDVGPYSTCAVPTSQFGYD
jgi:hypothetical protein